MLSEFELRGFDPELLLEVIRDARYEQRLLHTGAFHVRHVRVDWPDGPLELADYNLPVLARGAMPQDQLVIGFIERAREPTPMNGMATPGGSVQLWSEGREMAYRTPADMRWAAFHVGRDELQATAAGMLGREIPLAPGAWLNVQASPQAAAALAGTIGRVVALARGRAGRSAEVRRVCRELILEAALVPLASGLRQDRSGPGRPPNRDRLVRRARLCALDRLDQPFSLARLAADSGSSPRTLQAAFRAQLNTSPQRWVLDARLAAVRDDLTRADPARTRVTDILTGWGVMHLGRFAAEYRRRYGETPSQTLRRGRRE